MCKIKGKLFIKINSGNVEFLLKPLNNYISPDNKYAVAYDGEDCKSFELTDKKLKLVYSEDEKYINYLIDIAMNQKNVELSIRKNTDALCIVEFSYPCET
jgi:hypothetical protein